MSGWLVGAGPGGGLGRGGGCPSLACLRQSCFHHAGGERAADATYPRLWDLAGAGGEAVPEGSASDRDRGTFVPGRENCGGGQGALPGRAAVPGGVARVDRDHRQALGGGHRDDAVLELGGGEPGDHVPERLASTELLPGLGVGEVEVLDRDRGGAGGLRVLEDRGDRGAQTAVPGLASTRRPGRAGPGPVVPTGLPEVSTRVAARWSAFRSTPTTPPDRAAASSTGLGAGRTQESRR